MKYFTTKDFLRFILQFTWIAFAGCSAFKKDPVEVFSYKTDMDESSRDLADNLSEKIAALKTQLKERHSDPNLMFNLAKLYLVSGDLAAAEQHCRDGLRFDLKNIQAKKILAEIYFRKKNVTTAKMILDYFSDTKSDDAVTENLRGLVALEEKQLGDGLNHFKNAIAINPQFVAAKLNLGLLLLKYREIAAAAEQFNNVLAIDPHNVVAKIHLAVTHSAGGNYSAAKSLYEDVLSREKTNPLALYNLALVNKNLMFPDEALEQLQRYLDTNFARRNDQQEVLALMAELHEVKNDKIRDLLKDSQENSRRYDSREVPPPGLKDSAGDQSETVNKLEDELNL